jgi:hypothetical protein
VEARAVVEGVVREVGGARRGGEEESQRKQKNQTGMRGDTERWIFVIGHCSFDISYYSTIQGEVLCWRMKKINNK